MIANWEFPDANWEFLDASWEFLNGSWELLNGNREFLNGNREFLDANWERHGVVGSERAAFDAVRHRGRYCRRTTSDRSCAVKSTSAMTRE